MGCSCSTSRSELLRSGCVTPPSSQPARPRGPTLWGWLWRPALVVLVAGVLGWWMLSLPARERAELPEATPSPATAAPPAAVPPRAWRPREAVEPAPGCAPEAERRCLEGDAWWIDGCGVAYAVAEECGTRRCRAGTCEPEPPGCGDIPILGRCDGEVAVGCTAGQPFAVDCGARGQRCVPTEEGPVCKPLSEHACVAALEPPRCDGDELVACVEGERQRLDCGSRGAICGTPPGGGAAACLQLRPPVLPEGCDDACGCPDDTRREELCNGVDDDLDGFVDESGACEPVELVFFVIVDDDGQGSHAPQDVEDEVRRLQRLFARDDDFGLELRQAEVVRVSEPAWLELDADDLSAMVRSPTISERRDTFYVPIVLTDRVLVDGVPRPGLSTVPNGMCGGHRRVLDPQPPLGVVAVAKQRWPTTLAHELGHFLGLCHTHGDHPQQVIPVDPGAGEGRVCVEPCTLDGDGLCDTPADPGPGPCLVGPECQPVCTEGSSPDPTNVMAYYPECREGFTAEQAKLMRRTLALRRAWHRCIVGDGCACEVGAGQCPEAMSCRRYQRDGGQDDGSPYQRCALDGPVVAGGVCSGSHECSEGAQCIGQPDAPSRCVRPCGDDTPDCRCAQVGGVTHPICVNDLRRDDG